MIKAAIEKIAAMAAPNYKDLNETLFCDTDMRPVVEPRFRNPSTLNVNTLMAIKHYIEVNPDNLPTEENLVIHIENYDNVCLIGATRPQIGNERPFYIRARGPENRFQVGVWLGLEDFIIGLQSNFVITKTSQELIATLGLIANENIQTSADDGVSQTVEVKSGITIKEKKKIVNPIVLQPFITFPEIMQPEINYILRLRKSNRDEFPIQAMLVRMGDEWKLKTIQEIAYWFREVLPKVFMMA